MASSKIRLRSRPHQARSQATFDRILQAAAELLDELGWEGFNTNILAERSGHRVSAIYRYFPNKLAVVTALAEQLVDEWDTWLAGFGAKLDESGDFKACWAHFVDGFPELVEKQPGGPAVRRAMQASPELRAIDQADNERLADRLSTHLIRHSPKLPKAEAKAAARVLIESAVALIDLTRDAPRAEADRLIAQLKAMHFSYLDQLGRTRSA